MQLTPKQNEIAQDNHRFRVVNAGRRFGKTILSVEEMIGVAVSKDSQRVCYIAPTFQQARDIAWEHLKERCRPIAADTNESQLKITLKTQQGGTSTIVLKSWDAIESLRGQKFNFIVLDEVAMMRNFWIGWQEVLRPTLTDTKGGAMFISTPKGFNHFYDLYNLELDEKKGKSFKSFHATSYDNPHIDPDEINEAKEQITEDRFAQEYLGDFRKQEGLVYKEFDRTKHVIDTIPEKYDELIAGIDFGFTNPTAVLHIVRDGDDNFTVTHEWYKTGRTEEQIKDYVSSCNFNRIYPDPASPSAIEVMNQAGLPVVEVVKNKDSIKTGINKVRQLFKMGKLHVHKSCTNLISELESYSYPEKKDKKNEDEVPIKENDHALDALRYALMTNNADNIVPREVQIANYWEQKRNTNYNAR